MAGVIVGAIGIGWLGWVIQDAGNPEVRSVLRTWEVRDQHTVDATFEVRLSDGVTGATCLLRAFAKDHSTVGETNVNVESGEDGNVSTTLRTERRAVSVELIGCTAAD